MFLCFFYPFWTFSFLVCLSFSHFEIGEWGAGNPGEEKNGVGRCVWRFGVTSVLSNSSVFMRETTYEGLPL